MAAVNFTVSGEEADLIAQIVDRFDAVAPGETDPLSLSMDIAAVHANGCPLKLADLLASNDFDFAHDIFGIQKHLCRETGTLQHCFLPRFAA
jgi:hypothetical protein